MRTGHCLRRVAIVAALFGTSATTWLPAPAAVALVAHPAGPRLDVQVVGAPASDGASGVVVTYEVRASNPNPAATTYALDQALTFGAGIPVLSATVSTVPPGAIANLAWNGTTIPSVATAVALAGGATHVWRLTVDAVPGTTAPTSAAADCTMGLGETGTGLRTVATLTVGGTPVSETACAPTVLPSIGKSATVVSGPNAGSSSTATAGDSIEWKVGYNQGDPGTSRITDVIPPELAFEPSSLEVPQGWAPEWSTNGGTSWAGTEPGTGVDAVRATNTGGLTAGIPVPAPPAQSQQAGTGGDGYGPIPVGSRVYNIFHHQLARVYCTNKATGTSCYGGSASYYFVTTPGTALATSTVAGTAYVVVSNRIRAYVDPAQHLWVAGQLVTNGVVSTVGGWACADLSVTPPTSCPGTAWVQATTTLGPGASTGQANFGDLDFDTATGRMYAGDSAGNVYCFDTTTVALCPGAWPFTPGFTGPSSTLTNLAFNGRMMPGTTQLVAHRLNGATDLLACIDVAGPSVCAGWPAAPVVIDATGLNEYGAPMPVLDSALTAVLVCSFIGDMGGAANTIACRSLANGTAAVVPAGLLASFPVGNAIEYGWSNTGDWTIAGTRLFLPFRNFGGPSDRISCFDFATQAGCGAPWPITLNNVYPYMLATDDQEPGCIWELGDAGALRPIDASTGGACARTHALLTVAPLQSYCASSNPVIRDWDAVRLDNMTGAEFQQALLTIRDGNGTIVAPYTALDVTVQLATTGRVDISAIPYGGTTTQLSIDLELRGTDPAAFAVPPLPVVAMTWDGDPVEICFRTTVASVCNVAEVVNQADLAVTPNSGQPFGQSATYALLYEADATCLQLTKVLTGPPTPLGNGTWAVSYDVGVTNAAPAAAHYDLDDTLAFGTGISLISAAVTGVAPPGLVADPAWNGSTISRVASAVPIAGTDNHTWRVAATVSVPLALTAAAADCTLALGEAGTGLRNAAAITSGATGQATSACAPLPGFTIQKAALGNPVANGDGTWTTAYEILVTNSGAVSGPYDLSDSFQLGIGITAVAATVTNTAPGSIATSPAWNGVSNTSVVSGVVLAPGVTHRYLVTLRAAVPLRAPAPAATDCTLAPGEDGTGLRNQAMVHHNGRADAADDCRPTPSLVVSKSVTEDFTPNGDGTFRVGYALVVGNEGAAGTVYDLQDSLSFGAGIDVLSAVVTPTPPTLALAPGWNGRTVTALVANQPIAPSTTHSYAIQVNVRAPGPLPPQATDCTLAAGEAGTGLRNDGSVTSNGQNATTSACDLYGLVQITKEVAGGPHDVTGGRFEITYRLTVTSASAVPTTYDLHDQLRWGDDLEPISVEVTPPLGRSASPSFDGISQTTIASTVAIGVQGTPAGTHVWLVTVTGQRAGPAPDAAQDCSLAAGEAGTGLRNDATATAAGAAVTDTACVSASGISRPATSGSELARTGAALLTFGVVALLLLLLGGGAAGWGQRLDRPHGGPRPPRPGTRSWGVRTHRRSTIGRFFRWRAPPPAAPP